MTLSVEMRSNNKGEAEGTSGAHRALPGLGGAHPAARCGKETFLAAIARSDSFAKYGLPLDAELLARVEGTTAAKK